jgi:hypothetical protein
LTQLRNKFIKRSGSNTSYWNRSFLLAIKAHEELLTPLCARGVIMKNKRVSLNPSQNPDPQSKGTSGDDITPSKEQQTLPERLPQSPIEWLARINRRYLALDQEKTNDTS